MRKQAEAPDVVMPKADYDISRRNSRFRRQRRGVGTVGHSADYHYRNETDFVYALEYARDLDRNDIVAGMIVDRVVDNVLQDRGIALDPQTGDENLDVELRQRWIEWCDDADQCDISGEMSWRQIENQVLRSQIVDGDVFVLPNVSGAVEVIEAHRCRTPRNTKRNVVHGVLLDDARRRLQYWFTKADVDPNRSLHRVSDMVRVDARGGDGFRQVFQVYNRHRISQTRGVTAFRRTADAFGMHDDMQFANLVRQQIAACFAIIRERELNSAPGAGGAQYGERELSSTGMHQRLVEGVSPGMEIAGEPGEKILGFSPNIPNPTFFDHVSLLLKIMSANLGLPMQAVLFDASQTNFSGWRGAMDQARAGLRRMQADLTRQLHRRVYLWKVRGWLGERRLRTLATQGGVDPFWHRWNCPTWDYIEPLKDVTADVTSQTALHNSPRRIQANHGRDWDDVSDEIVEDNVKLIRKARDAARMLNSEAEDEAERLHWREVLAMPIHQGLQIGLAVGGPTTTNQPGEDE